MLKRPRQVQTGAGRGLTAAHLSLMAGPAASSAPIRKTSAAALNFSPLVC